MQSKAVLAIFILLAGIFAISIPSAQVVTTSIPRVGTNLVTWTQQNGYSSIQWNNLTEISVFHMIINPDGSLSYDGDTVNVSNVISNARQNNVKVLLAVGGSGIPATTIDNILSNQAMQQTVIKNIVNQVKEQHYNGTEIDIENTNACDFNSIEFTGFMKNLSTAIWNANPNYKVSVAYADWEKCSINLTAIEPYANEIDDMLYFNSINKTFNDSIINDANLLKNSSKLFIGYDLQLINDPQVLENSIATNEHKGYGVFFWQTENINSTIWSDIHKAIMNPVCSGTPILKFGINNATADSQIIASVSGLSNCAGQLIKIKDYQGCNNGELITSFISNNTGGVVLSQNPGFNGAGQYGYYACIGNVSSTKAILTIQAIPNIPIISITSSITATTSGIQTQTASTLSTTSTTTTVPAINLYNSLNISIRNDIYENQYITIYNCTPNDSIELKYGFTSTTVTTQLFNGNYTCPSNDTIVLYRHIIWWTNSGQPTYIQATDLNTSYEGPIHNQSVFIV